MNKNKIKTILFAILIFELGFIAGKIISPKFISGEKSKLQSAIEIIDKNYVEKDALSQNTDDILPLILEKLDPHSAYLTPQKKIQSDEHLDGKIKGGIGIRYNIFSDTLVITNVLKNTPAQEARLLAGDKIIKIDTTTIAPASKTSSDINNLIKGDINSTVNLTIKRYGRDNPITIKVKRSTIKIPSINIAYNITPDVRYIQISSFGENTYNEFYNQTINTQETFNTLIIDLRDNSGGYLKSVIKIANELLEPKSLIVYTKDRNNKKQEYYADKDNQLNNKNIIILVNQWSASASEILAGTIQDNDRGTIIGRRTYGKGLVQSQFKLDDGSLIKLTTDRYYTPTGRSIQKPYGKGIDYRGEIQKRLNEGQLDSAAKNTFPDSLKFKTPKGKIVYGGGGIMPDIFVPEDEKNLSGFLATCNRNYLFEIFTALEYNKASTKNKQNPETIIKKQTNISQKFINFAKTYGIEPAKDEFIDNQYIKTMIYAHLYEIIGQDEQYYRQIQTYDNDIKQALSTIENL